jgi:hypothetical protein
MLGAGFGVPMEYFNSKNATALTRRWGIGKREFLEVLYAKRTFNGVFAIKLHGDQFSAWPHQRDLDNLFDQATVIHLQRPDRTAQAASLAASMLTGCWGSDPVPGSDPSTQLKATVRRAIRRAADSLTQRADRLARLLSGRPARPDLGGEDGFSGGEMRRMARLAVRRVAENDQAWERWFQAKGIVPMRLSMETALGADLSLVSGISERLGILPDLAGAERMLGCGSGKYTLHLALKQKLRTLIENECQ